MSKNEKENPVVGIAGDSGLYKAAKDLALKMLAIEQDPDIISVFSIALAHGYKVTSRFWHDELKALVASLEAADEKAKANLAPVVPFEPEVSNPA